MRPCRMASLQRPSPLPQCVTAPTYKYCILALATSGANPGILSHGEPSADLNGCNTMSNTDNSCTGHNMNAGIANAHGTSSVCGATQNSNVPVVSDPYSGLAANIPANTCASYPQEPKKGSLPASNRWNGVLQSQWLPNSLRRSAAHRQHQFHLFEQPRPGHRKRTARHERLHPCEYRQRRIDGRVHGEQRRDLHLCSDRRRHVEHRCADVRPLGRGRDLPGSQSDERRKYLCGGQHPHLEHQRSRLSPHSSVTLSGAVNKSANGAQCMLMVVDNITVNGTGGIFAKDTEMRRGRSHQSTGRRRARHDSELTDDDERNLEVFLPG